MNKLQYIDEFTKALAEYKLSSSAQKTLSDMRLCLLVAASSSGRNTIIRELIETGDYHFIVSDTTRQPRENDGVFEQNGREYWFRDEAGMLEDIREGNFLEAAVIHKQQVSGISIRELKNAHDDNKIAVTDVEVDGAAHVHRAKPDTHIIFIVPPSFEVWLDRFHRRGRLPDDEVRRRLESAANEFSEAIACDYYKFVVNDDLSEAVAKVYEITKVGIVNRADQLHGRATIETLLKDTVSYLSKK